MRLYRFQGVDRCVSVGPARRDTDRQVSGSARARRSFLINATSVPIRVAVVTGGTLAAARRPPSDELVTSAAAATPDNHRKEPGISVNNPDMREIRE